LTAVGFSGILFSIFVSCTASGILTSCFFSFYTATGISILSSLFDLSCRTGLFITGVSSLLGLLLSTLGIYFSSYFFTSEISFSFFASFFY
jgi:hypothetical protein